jgi:hypothetical protein
MTGAWLTLGGGLIVALLVLGAVLPRPQPEYPLVEIPGITSPERQASRFAFFGGKPGKGEGHRSAQKPPDDKQDPNAPQGKRGEDGQKTDDKSAPEGKDGKKSDGQNDGQNKRNGAQGDERGKPGEEKDSKGRPTKDPRDKQDEKGGDRKQDEQPQSGPSQNQRNEQPQRNEAVQQTPSSNSPLGSLSSLLAGLAPILKWIVFAVFALVVLFLVLRGGLRFLANFSDWAKGILDAFRSWWQALFGSLGERSKGGEEEAVESAPGAPRKTFGSFRNPFLDGRAERLTPEKLVRYSFEALEAWAWEHHLGRQPDETALEFAQRIGEEVPALEADARRLAGLYARVLYARGGLPASSPETVRQFWERLEAVAEQPLSACGIV